MAKDGEELRAKETADRVWQKYLSEGEFRGFVDQGILRRLWEDHVRVELDEPSEEFLAGKDLFGRVRDAETAVLVLELDWVNLLHRSYWLEEPPTQVARESDLILETIRRCPEGVLYGGGVGFEQVLAGTPERIVAMADAMVEAKKSGDRIEPVVLKGFSTILEDHVVLEDPLGPTSLEALTRLADAGMIDLKGVANLRTDPEIVETILMKALQTLDAKTRTGDVEGFQKALDGKGPKTKIIDDGIKRGKDVTKK